MKETRFNTKEWSRTLLAVSFGLLCSVPAHGVPLSAASALPAGSSTTPGFAVRVAQAPEAEPVANNSARAVQQINGTLKDSLGALVPNEAVPGTEPDKGYIQATVNFERDAAAFDLLDYANGNTFLASFTPDFFPGIPGSGSHTTQFAVEAVGFLDLPVGTTTFGVSAGTDRTDVNDDDSFAVFVSRNPRDFFGLKVAEFSRNGVPAFGGNTKNENQFTVEVTTAGLYPFRILYWQGGRGANLQFYSIKNDERILVNDLTNPAAIKSFAKTTVANAKGPYVSEIRPVPGSAGNSSAAPIEAVIVDGSPDTVPTTGVQLRLNGTLVAPVVTRTAPLVTVAFNPNPNRTNPESVVRLNYTDSAGGTWQNDWSYGIKVSGGSGTTVTGQWDFDSGSLAATVGQPLQYFDGPTGLTQQGTKFGTTSSLGVKPIAGREATIMEIPGDLKREIGYIMTHGIAPNGGGTRVNQYTLIMDVFVDTAGPGAASLFQTSSLTNTDDGDLFWQGNNFGQGGDGYKGTGQFTAGAWHRVVAAYDEAATPPVVTKYVDCIKQDDWTANQGLDNARRAMLPTAILFGDGDQDERRKMWVNAIQVRSGKMTDAEIVALGGPSADGIPSVILPTKVTGQWDFELGNLAATAGKPLTYLDGVGGLTETGTQFGLCSELGVPLIEGQNAKIMKVPGDLKREIGYVMDHGIKPNGGGTKVNQYTLVMDIYVGTAGPGAASLLQLSSPANTDDGDLFWQGSNFGQGGGGYNGTGQFTAGSWHRVVAAYDMAAPTPVVTKYVDGIKQDDWTANQGLDNPRRAMQPTAILFGDGDQDERREMFVNSIQVREGKLSDAEIYLLGKPQASGIPVVVPAFAVAGQWDFDRGNLASTIGKPLAYLDGAEGLTKTGTQFGTCTELGVPLINGQEALVMKVPGDLQREIGYVMDHGIQPNGGGQRVNQYTLVMDVFIGTAGPGAASLLQLSSLANTDDGDLFWQGSNFGQGGGGYNGTGQFTAGAWHRMVAAYDMAATPPVVTKYVDGIKQDDWTANQGLDNPRRAMQPTAILFGDGDQDERREMFVNSIQIREGKLSDAEIYLMGGPQASGIPVPVTTSPVTGQWDFEGGNLASSIGKPLTYFDGPEGLTKTGTMFGTCTELGVDLINGKDARIMKVPGDLVREIGYVMDHGIKPNGGGARVNQYTLAMDIYVGTSGPGAASLWQLSSLTNTDDGDLFWQGNNFGQGGNGYIGTGQWTAGSWHRVIAAYDEAATPPVVTKFVDGIKQDDWTANQGLDNPRRAMQPTAILFGDGDQDERREMFVDSIQIRAGKMSDAEMIAFGAPTGTALPVGPVAGGGTTVTPTNPGTNPGGESTALDILVLPATNEMVISWPPISRHGTVYSLESSSTMLPDSWTPVPTTGTSVTLPIGPGKMFFRLRY